ncbi:MAG: polysaccharide pyruvyl transferase family protein [Cyanobacteria bacterium J06621_12]
MKIIISNTVILNGGDAAILDSIIKILQSAFGTETEFVVYDSQPETASIYYPELNLRQLIYLQSINSIRIRYVGRIIKLLAQWRLKVAAWCLDKNLLAIAKPLTSETEYATLLDYKTADLIVTTGGTYLVENYSLKPRFFDFQLALMLHKPLMFFTQSLGPFEQPENRRTLAKVFDQSPLILLRDRRSQTHIKELLSEQDKAVVVADAAFALANSEVLEAAKNKNKQGDFAPAKIAISVRDWQYFQTIDPELGIKKYIQSLVALTIHLVAKYQADITYISSCQGIKEYWKDDSEFALKIVQHLPDNISDRVTVNRDFNPPEKIAQIISDYDLVIATRLHMAILSLGAGVPVFPIAYEFKTQELFAKLGCGKWTVDIEAIEAASLIEKVDDYIAAVPQIRAQLFAGIQEERASAWESSDLVQQAYKKWQESKDDL